MVFGFPKPIRGESLQKRKERRRERDRHEDREMTAAKKRDGWNCRFPGCQFRDLPVDACHLQHRGIGGNPSGDRTTRDSIISLCRRHHGLLDQAFLRIRTLTPQGSSGRCEFWDRQPWSDEEIYRGQT